MRRFLAALTACCALASVSSCGARLDDEQMAAALGRGAQGGDGAVVAGESVAASDASGVDGAAVASADGVDPGAPVDAAASAGGSPGAADAGAEPASGQPGSAGPAPGTVSGGGGGGACRPAGGATDTGVRDTEIAIGNVSTISGPVPGLGQTSVNGVKAYVAYVNSRGGVCGRRLRLVTGDDRLDTGANRSEHERLKDDVFAFVGGFSVVDDGGATVLDGTNVPDVALSVSDRRNAIANNFSPQPINPKGQTNGLVPMFAYFKSAYGITKSGVVYPAQSVAKDKATAYVNDMRTAGLDVVVQAEVAITQTDYNGVATQMKNAGAELVITALETTGMARLAQAFRQQDYRPKVPFYGAQAYGRKFLQQAGAAADGTLIGVAYTIPEDTATPMAATMAQWYARANPGAELDYFSIVSWTATDMFVKALTAAGPAPTRDKVLEVLRGYRDFTADGLLAPRTDPAGKNPSPCFAVLGVEGGKWKRVHPASGFVC